MTAPRTPAKMGTDGARLWRDVTSKWTLRPDELRVLEAAARQIDRIAAMEKTLDGADLVVTGSQGQPVAHPLVVECRLARSALARLLEQLGLPDEDGQPALSARSRRAQRAAQSRWAQRDARAKGAG